MSNPVRAFRQRLGLNRAQFAYAIGYWDGIGPAENRLRRIRRWEDGSEAAPGYIFMLVQACTAFPGLAAWVTARGLYGLSPSATEPERPSGPQPGDAP